MTVGEVAAAMEVIAPTRYAETWDNVGLLVGDPNAPARATMLCIDCTRAVSAEAREGKCDVVIAYHPPIFSGLKRIDAQSPIHAAIASGMAIYSPHTAWDAATGGVNDVLADLMEMTDCRALRPAVDAARQCKLVTFVPREALERVSAAVFAAGAGQIGNYSSCGFTTDGTGTFLGNEQSRPTVGKPGRLEQAAEARFETVVPLNRCAEVILALRATHPYEEPAFDLVTLTSQPSDAGMGRIGSVSSIGRADMIDRIKRALGLERVLVAGPVDGAIERVACCAGAGGELLNDALAGGAQLYLTGELRHHDALRAAEAGMTVVCALHSNTERISLPALGKLLKQQLPALDIQISRRDHEPFSIR